MLTALALDHTVQNHGAEQDGKACENALADGRVLQRLENIFTKSFGADQRGHNDHGKTEHDGLVDARQDGGGSQRQVDFCQQIPFRPAIGDCRFPDRLRHTRNPSTVRRTTGDTSKWQLPGTRHDPIPYLAFARGSFLGAVVEHELKDNYAWLNVRHIDAFAEALKSLALQGSGLAWLPAASVRQELQNGTLRLAAGQDWSTHLTLSLYANPATLSRRGRKIWKFFESMTAPEQNTKISAHR